MKTFYQYEIALHFLGTVILFLISAFMFQIQIFVGIIFLISSLFYLSCCFLVIFKINIFKDQLIAYKLLGRNSISFKNINGLTVENRHFIGEGRFSTRKALVIVYTEDSGYGDELVLTYNDELYHYLENQLGTLVKDNKSKETNLISSIKRRLSWFERRTYRKIVDVEPQSEDMALFQKYYKDIYGFGDTLHIHVDVTKNGVKVPEQYVKDEKIVMDISPRAIAKFEWISDGLKFKAKFNGKARIVEIPLASLLAIYNLETQLGVEVGYKKEA